MNLETQLKELIPIAKEFDLNLSIGRELHKAYEIFLDRKPRIADELFMKLMVNLRDSQYDGRDKITIEYKQIILN